MICACVHMWLCRREHWPALAEKEAQLEAAVLGMQARARGFLVRTMFQHGIAEAIQRGRQKHRMQRQTAAAAATRIQALWRGYAFRHAHPELLQRISQGALATLQARRRAGSVVCAAVVMFLARSTH